MTAKPVIQGPVARITELAGLPLVQSAHLLVLEGEAIASLILYWPPGHDPFDPDQEPDGLDSAVMSALRAEGLQIVTYLGGEPVQMTEVAVREELFMRVTPTNPES